MKMIAAYAHSIRARGLFCLISLALAGCGSLQPAARPLVYDFGPGSTLPAPTPASPAASLPLLSMAGVQAASALDSTAVLYRLAYSDAQQQRPYAQARWSMPPAELVRQRIREQLSLRRTVLNTTDGQLASTPGLTLRLELDEFSQLFESAERSVGLIRLRATLGAVEAGSRERLIAQRRFVVQRPSTSPDAAGGVRALTAAAAALSEEIDQWVAQQ
jgi:cholesterol transport system auxiliary component